MPWGVSSACTHGSGHTSAHWPPGPAVDGGYQGLGGGLVPALPQSLLLFLPLGGTPFPVRPGPAPGPLWAFLPTQPVLPVAPAVGAVASLCFPGQGGAGCCESAARAWGAQWIPGTRFRAGQKVKGAARPS